MNVKVNLNEIKNVNEEEVKAPSNFNKYKANIPPPQQRQPIPEKKDNKDLPPKPVAEGPQTVIRKQNAEKFLKNFPAPKPKPILIPPSNNNNIKNRPISAQQSPLNKIEPPKKLETPLNNNANKPNLLFKKPDPPNPNPKQPLFKRVLSSEPKKVEKKEGNIQKSPALKPPIKELKPQTPPVKSNALKPNTPPVKVVNKISNIGINEKNKAINKEKEANKEKDEAAIKEKEIAAKKEKERKDRELAIAKEREMKWKKEKELAIVKERELAAKKEKEKALAKEKELAVAKEKEKEKAVAKEKELKELAIAKEKENERIKKEREEKEKETTNNNNNSKEVINNNSKIKELDNNTIKSHEIKPKNEEKNVITNLKEVHKEKEIPHKEKEITPNNSQLKNSNLSKSEDKKDIEKIFPRKVSVNFYF